MYSNRGSQTSGFFIIQSSDEQFSLEQPTRNSLLQLAISIGSLQPEIYTSNVTSIDRLKRFRQNKINMLVQKSTLLMNECTQKIHLKASTQSCMMSGNSVPAEFCCFDSVLVWIMFQQKTVLSYVDSFVWNLE